MPWFSVSKRMPVVRQILQDKHSKHKRPVQEHLAVAATILCVGKPEATCLVN